MKTLTEYLKEEVSTSLGDAMARSTYATPGNTMGMGDPKPPTPEEFGSELFGITKKDKKKKKKEKN